MFTMIYAMINLPDDCRDELKYAMTSNHTPLPKECNRNKDKKLVCKAMAKRLPSAADDQFPVPCSAEKYFSNLPSSPLWASASAGASPFDVILGHCAENVVFSSIHCSRPLSVSGKIAPAGPSGSHTPQSQHSLG